MTDRYATPLSQRMASERWKNKLEQRGLIRTEVTVPEHRREDIQQAALLMRLEHETGEKHETK